MRTADEDDVRELLDPYDGIGLKLTQRESQAAALMGKYSRPITSNQLADALGLGQPSISKIIGSLRHKLKKHAPDYDIRTEYKAGYSLVTGFLGRVQ